MGRGRNSRHKKRRREQSRKAKREEKKERKAKDRKWKNQPNPTPKYRKRKRNKGKKMFNYSGNVQCIHLGMSGRFLIEPKYAEYLVHLKEWYDEGVISDISFLVFGEWNTKTRKRLCGMLEDNNHKWAINHLLFRNSEEYDASFMVKKARCLNMTHYADMDKDSISNFVMSNMYGKIKLFCWNDQDHEKGWEEFKTWLKKHNPTHYNLWEQGERAAEIIQTGIYAETVESKSGDNIIWLGTPNGSEILDAT